MNIYQSALIMSTIHLHIVIAVDFLSEAHHQGDDWKDA